MATPHAFSPASQNPCNVNLLRSGILFRPLKMYLFTSNLDASLISAIHLSHRFFISSGSLSSHPKGFPSFLYVHACCRINFPLSIKGCSNHVGL